MLLRSFVRPGTRRSRVALLATVAAPLLAAPAAAGASASEVDLIVRRDAGLSSAERADIRADAGVELERRLRLDDTELVSVPAARADAALRALRADPDVRWAGRDTPVHAAADTTDPFFHTLWALQSSADADMDFVEAWPLATGSGVTVAVVDTGVQADHPDLATQLDPYPGSDYIDDDDDPADGHGHGTHVSGTIAAANGNGVGITGAAPDARVLTLRVLDDDGWGSMSHVADAFDLAGDLGVRVVNASLGGTGAVPTITQAANEHPRTLYVVAAGNDDLDLDAAGPSYFPCEAPAANVLCVGASDWADARASFSNYGASAVDVYAPGVGIYSTSLGGGYAYKQGTSMATPHVAAAAALLFERNPSLDAAAVKAALLVSAEPRPGLVSVSGGRANALRALTDGDKDGVPDVADNCPSLANPVQSDADADGDGDACDTTPRGPDADGDGLPAIDDRCPGVAGPAGNGGCPVAVADRDRDGVPDAVDGCPDVAARTTSGCPASPAGPRIVSVRVGRSRCRGATRCTIRVRVRATQAADIRVRALRLRCHLGSCRWRPAATARAARGRSTTARLRLPAGRYRLTVTATAAGARAKRSLTVRVR
jgi:thermitase